MKKRCSLNFHSLLELVLGTSIGILLLYFTHYIHYFMVQLGVVFSSGFQISNLWRYEDFSHYYGAAWHFLNSSRVYGESLEFLQASGFVLAKEIPSATNPPLLVLLLSFLARLHPETGWMILQLVSVLSAILAIELVIRNFAPQEPRRIKTSIFVLSLIGFWFIQHLLYCQIQSILFLLSMMSWSALRKANNILAGALIGFAISLKLFLWPLALFLILTGRHMAIFSAVIVIASLFLLTQSFGSLSYVDFFNHAVPIIKECGRSSILNLSLFGGLSKLYFAFSLVLGVDRIEFVDTILYLLSSLVFPCAVTLFAYFRYARGLLEEDIFFVSILVISIISSPVCWPHYMCFAIPLFTLIGLRRMIRRSVVIAIWLAAPWISIYAFGSHMIQLVVLSVLPTLIMPFLLFQALTYSSRRFTVWES